MIFPNSEFKGFSEAKSKRVNYTQWTGKEKPETGPDSEVSEGFPPTWARLRESKLPVEPFLNTVRDCI